MTNYFKNIIKVFKIVHNSSYYKYGFEVWLIINNDSRPLHKGKVDNRIWVFDSKDEAVSFLEPFVSKGSYEKIDDDTYLDIKQDPPKERKIVKARILYD